MPRPKNPPNINADESKKVNKKANTQANTQADPQNDLNDPQNDLNDESDADLNADLNAELNANLNSRDKVKYDYQRVLCDDIIYTHPDNRRTSEIMTEYELAEVISVRSKQIENDGTVFTDTNGLTDPIQLAFKEVLDKKCPLDVRRPLTDKIYERWHVNEMAINPDVISSVRNFSSQFIK